MRIPTDGQAQETLPTCELCGEPMPPGEEMFKFHGYSGPCPKPPLPVTPPSCSSCASLQQERDALREALREALAFRAEQLEYTCPDCEDGCTHGINADRLSAILRAALQPHTEEPPR